MKKIPILFALVYVLGLFGCTPVDDSSNGDQDLQDNQINDSTIVDDPVIPDIVVVNEKDKLADMYVKGLYDYIIVYSDEMNCFHSDALVESSTLSMQDMKRLAYWVGSLDNVVYTGAGTDYGKYFDFEDLDYTIKRIFGPNVEVDTKEWYAGGMSYVYIDRMNRFGGDASYGGDYPVSMIFDYFGKYELDGDFLYIYDRVLFCEHDRWGTGIIKFYSDINKTEESYVNEFQVGDYLPSDFSNDEALEQYGAEYKHTFKLTEDGSYYYWVSSEPVK